MDIQFKNTKLEKLCNSFSSLVKKYGNKQAETISRRLQQLSAAENLHDAGKLPRLHCHELKGDRKNQLAVDLEHPFRLIFVVNQDPIPRKPDSGLDWKQVQSIKIIRIEDYHGKQKRK